MEAKQRRAFRRASPFVAMIHLDHPRKAVCHFKAIDIKLVFLSIQHVLRSSENCACLNMILLHEAVNKLSFDKLACPWLSLFRADNVQAQMVVAIEMSVHQWMSLFVERGLMSAKLTQSESGCMFA